MGWGGGFTWCNCRVLNVRGVTGHLCGNTRRGTEEESNYENAKKLENLLSVKSHLKCSY